MASEKNLKDAFQLLASTSGGEDGNLSGNVIKKWFKQSGIIGKEITDHDLQDVLEKTVPDMNAVDFADLKQCLANLALEKKVDPKEMMDKLANIVSPKRGIESESDDTNLVTT
ncbi:hypothetical protein CDAR_240291 [Caerostris darwini]|uniref:Uncharacterized protein n=1 Tax=Caerostris darwini TaxID=1538125 RepID=A0AAV4QGT0_9ARAC|nr:hypothetical protein CDAR_240291 [Caerostris darwini]